MEELIKELSSIYDKENMNTFVSLYFDGKDRKFFERRQKACKAVLEGIELENFLNTIEEIWKYLENKPMAIFASHVHNFLKILHLPKMKNMLVLLIPHLI